MRHLRGDRNQAHHRFSPPWLLIVIALLWSLAALSLPSPVANAATITVTTTVDEYNSDGDCSLREALAAVNEDRTVDGCAAGSGADTIALPAGIYNLALAGSGTTIGDLDISDDLTLLGAGVRDTVIDGSGLDRVLAIYSGSVVSVAGLTIRGGDSGVAGGSGIWVRDSTVTLSRVRVMDNIPQGGIFLVGTSSLTLERSQVVDNGGSGILMQSTTSATIFDSTISGNTDANNGAGINVNGGTLTVVNSTISGNQAFDYGGGINAAGGTTNLYNVTITGNTANRDGGTIGEGGGVYMFGSGTLQARNSIIAGNTDNSVSSPARDCAGPLSSGGYNLIEDTAGCTITGSTLFDRTGVSPLLGPLQDNSGPTLTHALLTGSPAVDGGNPNGCADQNNRDLTLDQRGFLRTARCDMGAYEFGSPGAATPTSTPTATRTPTHTATSTATRTPTATATLIPISTSTATATPGNTFTATAQAASSPTPTGAPPSTATEDAGEAPSSTPSASPQSTPPAETTGTASLPAPAPYSVYLPLISE